jgi:hypothetical protein
MSNVGMCTDWLAEPLTRDHFVQTYVQSRDLVDSLAVFAGAGLGKGDAVVVVARPGHAKALEDRLAADAFDVKDLEDWGQLRILDAVGVLEEFMVAGRPDRERFRAICTGLIAKARVCSRTGRVRIYGEMVDVLWQQGNVAAASQLEAYWNEIIHAFCIPLFCAYRVAGDCTLPEELSRAHSHVIPSLTAV